MKIPGEVRRALRDAPAAEPPRPLPMAEAGETVQDASSVWDYLAGAGAPEPVRKAFERVCERACVPYIIELEHTTDETQGGENMLSIDERKTLERFAGVWPWLTEMQKAQLCAFAEGMAMVAETGRAS